VKHEKYVLDWEHREKSLIIKKAPHDQHNFDMYLQWLHRSTRTHIQGPYKDNPIDEDDNEDEITDAYNDATRVDTQLQRAPL
jgi:hypothetical protein